MRLQHITGGKEKYIFGGCKRNFSSTTPLPTETLKRTDILVTSLTEKKESAEYLVLSQLEKSILSTSTWTMVKAQRSVGVCPGGGRGVDIGKEAEKNFEWC